MRTGGDDYTVKTGLRPDFYEWSTTFSLNELRIRLEHLDFDHATGLRPPNIERALFLPGIASERERFLSAPAEVQADRLASVLESVGHSARVAHLVAHTDRKRFVPAQLQGATFLDETMQVEGETYLTQPSLVALMLSVAQRNVRRVGTVLEIGSGTGYHLDRACRLLEANSGIGVERDFRMREQAAERTDRGMETAVRFVAPDELLNVLPQADYAFATCALDDSSFTSATALMPPDGYFSAPRTLRKYEFEGEASDSWLRRTFQSYDGYLSSPRRHEFLVIETVRKGRDSRPDAVLDVLYDVRFVPQRTDDP